MTIKYIPFPAEIRGVVFGMIYGSGNVVIDNTQPEETQQRALRHELAHLVLGHQDTDMPIKAQVIQMETLKKIPAALPAGEKKWHLPWFKKRQ